MAKRVSLQKIKSNRPYSVDEIAEELGVTPQTIRAWGDQGMLMLKERRPHLVLGFSVREFLTKRTQMAKRPLEIETLAAYKSEVIEGMRVCRLSSTWWMKVAVEFQFEAVLGKTRRTEF